MRPTRSRSDIVLIESDAMDVYLLWDALKQLSTRTSLVVLRDETESFDYLAQKDLGAHVAIPALVVIGPTIPLEQTQAIAQQIVDLDLCARVKVVVLTDEYDNDTIEDLCESTHCVTFNVDTVNYGTVAEGIQRFLTPQLRSDTSPLSCEELEPFQSESVAPIVGTSTH